MSVDNELLDEKIARLEKGRSLAFWKSKPTRRSVSPSSDQPYGVARATAVWNLVRSSFYAAGQRHLHPHDPQERGPKVRSD